MNKRHLISFFAASLLFAVLFGVIATGAPAINAELSDIEVKNGSLRKTSSGISFTITAPEAELYWPIGDDDIFDGANTLAIALSNYSLCTGIDIELVYDDGTAAALEIDTEQYSTMKTYTSPAESCDRIVGIKMYFGHTQSGEIIFYFVNLVSFFDENIERIGEISVCSYNAGTLTVRGTLRHDSVRRHKDSTINIYALGPGDSVADVLSGAVEPIMTDGAISIRFEFSVNTGSDFAGLCKYVAAAISEEGIEFIDEPRYPDVSAPQGELAFKGVESSAVFGTTETGAGLSVLSVDHPSLFSTGNNGYMYTLDGERYFFDRNYVTRLDEKVQALSGASSDVYLRLAGALPVLEKSQQHELYVMVRFLAARYSAQSEHGRISGIVIGEGINSSIPEGINLSDYALAAYDAIYTVYAAANDAKNPIDAVISVSEDWGTAPTASAVSSDLFLEALFSVCGYYKENRFYIMAEASANPYSLDNEYIDKLGNIDAGDPAAKLKKADPDCHYISSENIARLYRTYEELSTRYLGTVPKLIYSWSPDGNTSGTALTASYVYNYYKLFFSRYISSFVVSFEGDDATQAQLLGELKYKMKYIDTDKSLEVGDFARDIFGIDGWKSEILSFKAEALTQRVLKDALTLETERPNDVVGAYEYWNFKTQSGHTGWQAGVGCSSLYLENNASGGRAMNVSIDPAAIVGEYAFFSYAYENEENFRYNDYMLLDLLINAPDNGKFEVNIMVGGDGFVYEYRSSDITAGNKYILSLDVSELNEKNTIEYIRICTKDLTPTGDKYTVSLYSVAAASRSYGSEQLRENILAERDRIHGNTDGDGAEAPDVIWMIVAGATVAMTVIVMVAVGRKKRARPEDRAQD